MTQKDSQTVRMEKRGQAQVVADSEVRLLGTIGVTGSEKSNEADESTLARKAAKWLKVPVPQTDTGRREENSKTNGRTLVKELGKMTP